VEPVGDDLLTVVKPMCKCSQHVVKYTLVCTGGTAEADWTAWSLGDGLLMAYELCDDNVYEKDGRTSPSATCGMHTPW
jgi:hypothetical protein